MKYKQTHFINKENRELMLILEKDKAFDEQMRMEASMARLVEEEKKAIYCEYCERLFIPKKPEITNCGWCVKEEMQENRQRFKNAPIFPMSMLSFYTSPFGGLVA